MEDQKSTSLETKKLDYWENIFSGDKSTKENLGQHKSKDDCSIFEEGDYFEQSLKQLFKEISVKQRLVLKMAFVQRLKNGQIAKNLNISSAAVSQIKKRAFGKLGKQLFYRALENEIIKQRTL